MKKISLFIAMSLDGYIADKYGKVDWLVSHSNDEEMIDTYGKFIENIDTVVMGYNTYQQIINELSPNEWVYEGLTSYVITHQELTSKENIIFTNEMPVSLVRKLQQETGKGIWICGGASIVQQLIKEDVIDEYYITVIPTILGSGIRLFDNIDQKIKLKLTKSQSYNGMVDLVYTKR